MKVWVVVVVVVSQSVGRRWWILHPSKLTTHLRISFTCSQLIPSLSNKKVIDDIIYTIDKGVKSGEADHFGGIVLA